VPDKRRHPRVSVNLSISCELSQGGTFPGVLVDVSMGGAFISSETSPAFGAELTIVGSLPGAPNVRLPAIVRWSKPGGFGVQFGLIGARETHALSVLVHGASSRS
jgi:type IV pilus assembly protein PilZ